MPSRLERGINTSTQQLVRSQVSLHPSRDAPAPLIRARDVWLRELISNSNDALEKFRLTSLTKKGFGNDDPLNITVKVVKDEGGKGGKVIIAGRLRSNKTTA